MEVDIILVKPNSYNPKLSIEDSEENKRKYEQIKAGIVEFGMNSPIDVREVDGGYEIIDGFHRWKACKELGFKKIKVASWGVMADDVAMKITILKEKARIPMDTIMTADILKQLSEGVDLETLARQVGYEVGELSEQIALADFDWHQYEDGELHLETVGKNSELMLRATPEQIVQIKQILGESEMGDPLKIRQIDKIEATADQKKIVFQAIGQVMKGNNWTKKGRALELICADFMAGDNPGEQT
jgi:ParB/RepB/Spo0J family partition protein